MDSPFANLTVNLSIKIKPFFLSFVLDSVGEWKKKTLFVTLGYVEITTLGINCMLKNLREGKSRSEKGIKKGIGLYSFIK